MHPQYHPDPHGPTRNVLYTHTNNSLFISFAICMEQTTIIWKQGDEHVLFTRLTSTDTHSHDHSAQRSGRHMHVLYGAAGLPIAEKKHTDDVKPNRRRKD